MDTHSAGQPVSVTFDGQPPVSLTFVPVGYQGPAQHTYTMTCDGFHAPGQCKGAAADIAYHER